jgi:hypothetical protein
MRRHRRVEGEETGKASLPKLVNFVFVGFPYFPFFNVPSQLDDAFVK